MPDPSLHSALHSALHPASDQEELTALDDDAVEVEAEARDEHDEPDERHAPPEPPTDEAPPVELPSVHDAAHTAGLYFRELGRLPVLRPREEFARTRHLEELEIAAWQRLLVEPGALRAVAAIVERVIGVALPELAALRRTAATPGARAARVAASGRAAVELRSHDPDKRALDAALAAVQAGTIAPRAAQWRRSVDEAARAARRAKNDFVQANLRLVVTIARRYDFGYLPLADLVQEGNIGLLKAVDRFDHRRGYRFSTYATWWIRHAIVRAIADKGRTIRVPVHMLDARQRLARREHDLARQLGRRPTREELAAASGVPEQQLERIGSARLDRPVSLDRPVGDDDERRLIDLVRDPEAEEHDAADQLVRRGLIEVVRAELARLKPIERDVLRQRFGISDTDEQRTLKSIGERYHLSRERIRQIQEQALARLRVALARKGLV